MSAVKASRAARAAADRRRVWYVMTSRVGREPREKIQAYHIRQPKKENGNKTEGVKSCEE